MKKLLFLLSFVALATCFTVSDISAQNFPTGIRLERDLDPDTAHVMISETADVKYRYGKYKSINTVTEKYLLTGYKEYTAILTQASTNAPTAVVLENTLGDTLEFTYQSVGYYKLLLDNSAFTANKTVVQITPSTSACCGTTHDVTVQGVGEIRLYTYSNIDGSAVNQGGKTFINIRVYN